MLYLPPDIAHDGTAVDECMTYSIGFRAPLYQEVVEAFLDHLRDSIGVAGPLRRSRPARAGAHPARIDAALRRQLAQRDRANCAGMGRTSARFIGRFLTEPKPDVVFAAPPRVSRPAFVRRAERGGVRLDRRTQLLYDDARYYLNGDDAPLAGRRPARAAAACRSPRADARPNSQRWRRQRLDLLYEWHRHGYLGNP